MLHFPCAGSLLIYIASPWKAFKTTKVFEPNRMYNGVTKQNMHKELHN